MSVTAVQYALDASKAIVGDLGFTVTLRSGTVISEAQVTREGLDNDICMIETEPTGGYAKGKQRRRTYVDIQDIEAISFHVGTELNI